MIKLKENIFWLWVLIFFVFLIISLTQAFCQVKTRSEQSETPIDRGSSAGPSEGNIDLKNFANFDSIMVIHFHPTAQCSCCINVGNFSRKGLERFYSKPYKDGRIIFKECNIDEDSLTARKYKIFGSALGFKKLFKGKEEFKEIESVWEFCEDEGKFLTDFQKELQSFVAGKKEEKNEKNSK
jgi:hypothetical protein